MSDRVFLPQIDINSTQILPQLKSGQMLMLDPQRQSGLIICKTHHAELAGPGAAVGGLCDLACVRAIALGDLALIRPESYEVRQQAYSRRQHWMDLTQKAMQPSVALRRAEAILTLLGLYFEAEAISQLPDEVLALLVGVLPRTINLARQPAQRSEESSFKNRRIKPIVTAGISS